MGNVAQKANGLLSAETKNRRNDEAKVEDEDERGKSTHTQKFINESGVRLCAAIVAVFVGIE